MSRLRTLDFPAEELKDISELIFSGITPLSGGDAYSEHGEGIPFVRSGDITDEGEISTEQEVFLKREVHEHMMSRSQLKKGDVLIAIVGATIGAVGVYKRSDEANINQAIASVRLTANSALPEYVSGFLKTITGQTLLDYVKRPVARANINLEEIGSLLIPLPPLSIQQELVAGLQAARERRAQHLREADAELAGIDAFLLNELNLF